MSNSQMLKGQIALVTGASRGIGAAIAQELGKQGAVVIGTATTKGGAESIHAALQQAGIQGAGTVSYTHLDVYKRQDGDCAIRIKNPAGYR